MGSKFHSRGLSGASRDFLGGFTGVSQRLVGRHPFDRSQSRIHSGLSGASRTLHGASSGLHGGYTDSPDTRQIRGAAVRSGASSCSYSLTIPAREALTVRSATASTRPTCTWHSSQPLRQSAHKELKQLVATKEKTENRRTTGRHGSASLPFVCLFLGCKRAKFPPFYKGPVQGWSVSRLPLEVWSTPLSVARSFRRSQCHASQGCTASQ